MRSLLRARRIAAVGIAALLTLVTGCSFAPNGRGPGQRETPLAWQPREELEAGRRAYAKALAGAKVLRSGEQFERVERVSRRLAAAIDLEPLQRELNLQTDEYPFEWEYCVIESGEINAFCLPGGKVAVYSGLLEIVGNDDQLAAVLAHEIAHAIAHHNSQRIARSRTLKGGLTTLSFDRSQELAADQIGVFLMAFAGYDPHEALTFCNQLQAIKRSRPKLPEILSDHPSDQRRLDQLSQWIPKAAAAKDAYDRDAHDRGRMLPVARASRSAPSR